MDLAKINKQVVRFELITFDKIIYFDIILNLSIKALLGTRIKISKNIEILMVEFDENIR